MARRVDPIEEVTPKEKRRPLLSDAIATALFLRSQQPKGRKAGALSRLRIRYQEFLSDPKKVPDVTKLRPEDRVAIMSDAQASLNRADRRALGDRGYMFGRGSLSPTLRTRKAV